MNESLRNIHIGSFELLPTPNAIREEFPSNDLASQTVSSARSSIKAILQGDDPRLLLVVGPCSIHDPKAALEYAEKLQKLSQEVSAVFCIVMRTYFEKPRTTVGWKGYINDPLLNDSFRIDRGLKLARKLLLDINSLGLPVGTEALDPITPQYMDDLISWTAIGARTVESQTHREMASGLSSPVGFKNGTDGNISVMINALKSVGQGHHFLGIDRDGRCSVFHTTGNHYAHAVLRGGKEPNYSSKHVSDCADQLLNSGLAADIMIDCSHGNSGKQAQHQPLVFADCINQILEGQSAIKGLMLESHLDWGNQALSSNLSELRYGVSVTDECIDWKTTEELIKSSADKLSHLT